MCFAHSAPQLYDKMINTRYIGKIIRDYREGRGMPLSAVIISISFLWIMILLSIFLAVKVLWLKLVLLGIAIAVSAHILKIKK
jgi:hypothetical protein